MKTLMVSTDRKVFDEESDVGARMVMFGSIVDELHIIVLSLESDGLEAIKLEDNVFVYPTNSQSRWHYFRDALRIGRNLSDISLVTAQDPSELGSIALRLGRHHNVPTELQIHTDIFSKHFRSASLINRFRVHLAKHNLLKADNVRVVSDRIRRSLLVHVNRRNRRIPINILPVFVDVSEIQRMAPKFDVHERYKQFDFVVFMASRLVKEKNISLALQAFSLLVEQHPRSGLVILGDGPLLYDLQSEASKLGIENNVMFEGWSDDSVSYLKTADAFLLTSDYEGYGRTLVESSIAGCPIVSTDVGIAAGVLHDGKGVLVCPVGDSECISKQLLHLIENPEHGKELARVASREIQEHVFGGWEEYLDVLDVSWKSCVSE